MYATNALKYKWVVDDELVFFGPVEGHIAEGGQCHLRAIEGSTRYKGEGRPLACKRVAELEGYVDRLGGCVKPVYVGSGTSELIKRVYTPLVF